MRPNIVGRCMSPTAAGDIEPHGRLDSQEPMIAALVNLIPASGVRASEARVLMSRGTRKEQKMGVRTSMPDEVCAAEPRSRYREAWQRVEVGRRRESALPEHSRVHVVPQSQLDFRPSLAGPFSHVDSLFAASL